MNRLDDLQHLAHLHHLRLYEPAVEEVPADHLHGVHLACQDGAAVIVSRCGLALEPSGQHTNMSSASPTPCPACDAVRSCPVCGARLDDTVAALLARARRSR